MRTSESCEPNAQHDPTRRTWPRLGSPSRSTRIRCRAAAASCAAGGAVSVLIGGVRRCAAAAAVAVAVVVVVVAAPVEAAEGPLTPTGLSASSVADGVLLEWEAPARDLVSVTGYRIVRRRTDVGETRLSQLVPDTGSLSTSFVDESAVEGGTYVYRVRAMRGSQRSGMSRRANITYEPPTDPALEDEAGWASEQLSPQGLAAEAGAGLVSLSWDPPEHDAESVTGYEVLRRRANRGEPDLSTLVADTATADTSYVDHSAGEVGVAYEYRVRARRGADASGYSDSATALVLQAATTGTDAAADPVGGLLLPDLVSDPSPWPGLVEEVTAPNGTQLLALRFAGFVTNLGDGPLDLEGNPQLADNADRTSHDVWQRALTADGDWVRLTKPPVKFEWTDGHSHFHLMDVVEYSLWDATGAVEIRSGAKVGFCLVDVMELSDLHPDPAPRRYRSNDPDIRLCMSGRPEATSVRMGVSAGWRDIYSFNAPFQWIDVSDVAPGRYLVGQRADPDNVIVESDETNNGLVLSDAVSVVPGYVALSNTVEVTAQRPARVVLGATKFSAADGNAAFPGARAHRIVTRPSHGTLDVGDTFLVTGRDGTLHEAFDGPSVTYTSAAGFVGVDSFTFVAFDRSRPLYPANPVAATVTLEVSGAAATVTIDNAPVWMAPGSSVDLDATVTGPGGGVTWSLDDVQVGNHTAGTIDPDGRYTAPLVPPASGTVTVRAASAEDPLSYAQATIAIADAPHVLSAMVEGTELTITYSEALIEHPAAGPEDFAVTVNRGAASESIATITAVLISGPRVSLVLSDALRSDDIVDVTYIPGVAPIRGAVHNEAASLDAEPVANNSPDAHAPSPTGAQVDGDQLSVFFDEDLDAVHVPSPTHFSVTFDHTDPQQPARSVSVSGVSVSANSITLMLTSPAAPGDIHVTVSYEVPITDALRDPAGNLVAAFADFDVTNMTTNHAPEFFDGAHVVTAATRTLAETASAGDPVGALLPAATDPDAGDTVTYTFDDGDGDDRVASFDFDERTRQVSVGADLDLDYETTVTYTATLTASDGAEESRLEVTINVANVDEAGALGFDMLQPQQHTPIQASILDPDVVVAALSWQWASSTAATGPFTDITTAATASSYVPSARDVGRYLRVTARYADGESPNKTLSAVVPHAVDPAPHSNATLVRNLSQPGGAVTADGEAQADSALLTTQAASTPRSALIAQQFTTGPNLGGFLLREVQLELAAESVATVTVQIHGDLGGAPDLAAPPTALSLSGASDESVATRESYTHSGVLLDANTSYWVVVRATGGDIGVGAATAGAEDDGHAAGWSIADAALTATSPTPNAWHTSAAGQAVRLALIGEPATTPALAAVLSVGAYEVASPPILGYSSLSRTGGLSGDSFVVDDRTYRVIILMDYGGGLLLGVNNELPEDFVLDVGGDSFVGSDSMVHPMAAAGRYWWPAPSRGWSAGDAVPVTITMGGPGVVAGRPLAPPSAFFSGVPETHNGVDAVSVRLNFVAEDLVVDAATLRDHGLEVSGAAVAQLRAASRDATRWDIQLLPDGPGEIVVSVPAAAHCAQPAAVCTLDGKGLRHRVSTAIAGNSHASLDALTLTGAALDGAFDPGVTAYSAHALPGVSQITLHAEAAATGAGAALSVDPGDADPTQIGHQIAVDPTGDTTIKIVVTAPDTTTHNTYTITITQNHN